MNRRKWASSSCSCHSDWRSVLLLVRVGDGCTSPCLKGYYWDRKKLILSAGSVRRDGTWPARFWDPSWRAYWIEGCIQRDFRLFEGAWCFYMFGIKYRNAVRVLFSQMAHFQLLNFIIFIGLSFFFMIFRWGYLSWLSAHDLIMKYFWKN